MTGRKMGKRHGERVLGEKEVKETQMNRRRKVRGASREGEVGKEGLSTLPLFPLLFGVA
jgi:hypothetical protein